MATPRAIERLHKLIWALIYSGLFTALIGLVSRREDPVTGWTLLVVGSCLVAAGVILIWVRSRLREGTIDS